jgi:hydroxymethylbilane synthase
VATFSPSPSDLRIVRVATRGSPLARWQAQRVIDHLHRVSDRLFELVVVRTAGDRLVDTPLARIGGQGVFVREVQTALLEGRADIAVHSAKDLPSWTPDGLVLASVPERSDPRDAMVGGTLDTLPAGAMVATGSVRRRAQLAWLRPDLTFCDLRGNMETRIRRAEDVGAGVVAWSALQRLGLQSHAVEVLDPAIVLPQVGQGALAVECRQDDETVVSLLRAVDDRSCHQELLAERAFLAAVGGGCTLPLGALARSSAHSTEELTLTGMIASRDGRVVLRRCVSGDDPARIGRALGTQLVEECGGSSLDDFSSQQAEIEYREGS